MRLERLTTRVASAVSAGALGLALAAASVAPANATGYAVGVLNCVVGPSVGVIVMTPAVLSCTFYPTRGPAEYYTGHIMKAGLDIGITAGTVISWGVVDQQSDYASQGLTGTYAGPSADASVLFGVGVNALFGGSNRSFVLTPISVQGQVGLDYALGITAMELQRA
jgi:uncharacterized protein DUF992